jgi:hypothetical protein
MKRMKSAVTALSVRRYMYRSAVHAIQSIRVLRGGKEVIDLFISQDSSPSKHSGEPAANTLEMENSSPN